MTYSRDSDVALRNSCSKHRWYYYFWRAIF